MKSQKTPLMPGKYFPADMRIPEQSDILSELSKFGYTGRGDIHLIDTSHSADDIRLNYIIDKRWVLRLCNAPEMTEQRLTELNRLIERYISFGLRCPRFLADREWRFFHEWNGLIAYLQEYIDLPTADEVQLEAQEEERLWQEVLDSVAGFAEAYRNVDLSQTMGMYSLFDLSPYDIPVGKDEKQQNFDDLCETLQKLGETDLAERLTARYRLIRDKIRAVYQTLPRCVFQADENLSNILVDENKHLAGFIDFNMAGTEVCESVCQPGRRIQGRSAGTHRSGDQDGVCHGKLSEISGTFASDIPCFRAGETGDPMVQLDRAGCGLAAGMFLP